MNLVLWPLHPRRSPEGGSQGLRLRRLRRGHQLDNYRSMTFLGAPREGSIPTGGTSQPVMCATARGRGRVPQLTAGSRSGAPATAPSCDGCRKSGRNRTRDNDGAPPLDADGSSPFHRGGGSHHLVRSVLVRIGAEDLRPWCSCLCPPRRGRRLGLALPRGQRRCSGRGCIGTSPHRAG